MAASTGVGPNPGSAVGLRTISPEYFVICPITPLSLLPQALTDPPPAGPKPHSLTQATQAACDARPPLGQQLQSLAEALVHTVHVDDAEAPTVVEYEPGAHAVQAVAASPVEYVPAAHWVHSVAPVVDENEPAGQGEQAPLQIFPPAKQPNSMNTSLFATIFTTPETLGTSCTLVNLPVFQCPISPCLL